MKPKTVWKESPPQKNAGGLRKLEAFLDFIPFSFNEFDSLPCFPKWCWQPRESAAPLFGFGALFGGSLADAQALLSASAPGIRAFGGTRFDPASPSSPTWADFPKEFFWIPRWELSPANDGIRATLHLRDGESHEPFVSSLFGLLNRQGMFPETNGKQQEKKENNLLNACGLPTLSEKNSARKIPSPAFRKNSRRFAAKNRDDRPTKTAWHSLVEAALQEIRNSRLEKIVLARESSLVAETTLPPFAFLQQLAASSSDAFLFGIQPTAASPCFLGATPELLYRRKGKRIESEAIAGTRPRGIDGTEDLHLGNQLLNGKKDRAEHSVVAEFLRATLSRICSASPDSPPAPSLLKLARLQHLRTKFEGTLQNGVSDTQILAAIHPTPATCGNPAAPALSFLRENEPFDRGWYSGPVGVITSDSAEFAVAIRSCLLCGPRLHLYAGAGIVEGSSPAEEWEELENKISAPLLVVKE